MSHTHAPDTTQAIKDRALTLDYEARRFPATAPMAKKWLMLAAAWAGRRGDPLLQAELFLCAVGLSTAQPVNDGGLS